MPSRIGRWNALRPADQAHAAGPLVDHRGPHRVGQVAGALGLAARS